MLTAKIFQNGRSQAIRLPKEFRFNEDEVRINKIGNIVMLIPKTHNWDSFIKALDMFSDDFMNERDKQTEQKRELL